MEATSSELQGLVTELLACLAKDNPEPQEQWYFSGFSEPAIQLLAIAEAEKTGLVETKGERNTPDWQIRLTKLGRYKLAGGVPRNDVRSDGYAALERLTNVARVMHVLEHGSRNVVPLSTDEVTDIASAMHYMRSQKSSMLQVAGLVADLEREIASLKKEHIQDMKSEV